MFSTIFNSLRSIVVRTRIEDAGQSMVEYALILSVISIAAVGALVLLGPAVTGALNTVTGSF